MVATFLSKVRMAITTINFAKTVKAAIVFAWFQWIIIKGAHHQTLLNAEKKETKQYKID